MIKKKITTIRFHEIAKQGIYKKKRIEREINNNNNKNNNTKKKTSTTTSIRFHATPNKESILFLGFLYIQISSSYDRPEAEILKKKNGEIKKENEFVNVRKYDTLMVN